MEHLNILSGKALLEFVNFRTGETKFGQLVKEVQPGESLEDQLQKSGCRYAILGIPESIGVKANLGQPAEVQPWEPFLRAFLNMQANHFLNPTEVLVLGGVQTEDLQQEANALDAQDSDDLETLRKLTSKLDERVAPVIEQIVRAGLVPIVIGGGHNNAYGCIKGSSKALAHKIQVINCDPHADFRALEGRHSGNGFSYAYSEGYIDQYFALGLHKPYNSEWVISEMEKADGVRFNWLDDAPFTELMAESIDFLGSQNPTGIELDLDAITGMPASAYTPSGLTLEQARYYIKTTSANLEPLYYHICEGAPLQDVDSQRHVGKSIAYLVADIVANR